MPLLRIKQFNVVVLLNLSATRLHKPEHFGISSSTPNPVFQMRLRPFDPARNHPLDRAIPIMHHKVGQGDLYNHCYFLTPLMAFTCVAIFPFLG